MIGKTVGSNYLVLRLLGQGGMGAVYEAEDRRTGVHVAVKVMHGDHIKRDSTRVGRFQREAKAAASIDSDHIARVLDWGTDDLGAPFIVMEMLAGEDLQELLKRVGALRPEVALRIAAQACLGLSKAHEAHVMHRDIKPANLFLARRGDGEVVVKILDFGVAKIRPEGEHGQETTGLTRTGGMIGSPMYMSPEQARGLKGVDFRTDLWSLGVVMYRALTGHTPHEDTEALGDLIVSLCSRPPKPIQDIARWVPPEIAAVAHGALQIAPEARFTDARAMLDALRSLLPQGDRLAESDLVPLDAASREVVAERLTETTADPSAPGVVGRTPAPSTSDERAAPTAPMMTTAAAGQQASASTAAPVVPTQAPPPPPAPTRWTAAVVAGVIGLVGVGAFGVLRVTSPSGATTAGPPDAGAAAEPPPPPPASVAPTVAPVAEAPRHVMLVVMPAGVSVDVDGAPAKVQDGAVEIEGTIGSVHRVRVYRGKAEVSADVSVTDSGAAPPKLELGRSGKAPAGPASSAPTTPKPHGTANPLIPDRFE